MNCGIFFKKAIIDDILFKFNQLTIGLIPFTSQVTNSLLFVKIDNKLLQSHQVAIREGQILIGDLHHKYTNAKPAENIDVFDIDKLIKNYWGDYVLIYQNNSAFSIFVAPFSRLQIFYIDYNEYTIFASEISFLANFLQLRLDDTYMQYFLFHGDFMSNFSPFQEIKVICNKQCLVLSADNSKITSYWDYRDYCTDEYNDLSKNIAEIFYNSITQKVISYDDFFLELSGGVDSSSILYALDKARNNGQKIYAVNLFDRQVSSSNELLYVEQLEKLIDFHLIKVDYANCMPYSKIDKLSLKPNAPTIGLSHLKKEQLLVEIASNYSKNPIFLNGHGGDSAFLCPSPLESLADLILDKQFGLFKLKLGQLAMSYRTTYWELLYATFKHISNHFFGSTSLFIYHKIAPWYSNVDEFKHNIISHQYYLHKTVKALLPGKTIHMYNLDVTLASTLTNLKGPSYSNWFPFLSQPLMELALSIKTYHSFNGEYDRYLFRKAINNFFSSEAVWRKNKGQTTAVFQRSLRENREYILDLCLNGYVAKSGSINNKQLEKYIDSVAKGICEYQWSLDHLLCYEIFVNCWKNLL